MQDLGKPSSYITLQPGAVIVSSDGEPLGKVQHVLADADADIFDGLVIDRSVLPGGHRFVDARQVNEVFEGGVRLNIDRRAAEALPEPSANPEEMKVDPAEGVDTPLEDKLRRAWDLVSGKRYD